MIKKIKISESDLYEIIKRVLIEQEQEQEKEVWITNQDEFKSRLDDVFDGNSEKFTKVHNKHYGKIVVKGYLYLRGTPIESLPDNLHVGGGLFLSDTPIESLPDNLHVWGDLDLANTPITSLPDNLVVGDDTMICIYGTPLNDNDELVKEYEAKGYKFDGFFT